jgi:hypothetical protein
MRSTSTANGAAGRPGAHASFGLSLGGIARKLYFLGRCW